MEDIVQNKVKVSFKIKVQWKNGSNETIFSKNPPNVNPVTPVFMDFKIKEGHVRHINMTEVRSLDMEIEELNIIT